MRRIKSMLRPLYRMIFGQSSRNYKTYSNKGSRYSITSVNKELSISEIGRQLGMLFFNTRQNLKCATDCKQAINELMLDFEAVVARLGELEKKPKRGRPRKSS